MATRNVGGRPKGYPKTGGRQAGTPNKATGEIREAAQQFLADPKGRAKLLAQYRAGKLHPTLVVMFHHYAFGKPKEEIEHSGNLAVNVLVVEVEKDASHDPATNGFAEAASLEGGGGPIVSVHLNGDSNLRPGGDG